MLISHECPICMLDESRQFNDYDYALVHLFENQPYYFDFFRRSLDEGRIVILDNSLYELGDAFDMDRYFHWIERLHPTAYIIPDAFWDADKTIRLRDEWMVNYGWKLPQDILKIGVAQGTTYKDIKRTYRYMDYTCDIIAFTFKFSPEISGDFELNRVMDNTAGTLSWDESGKRVIYLTGTDRQAMIRWLVLDRLRSDGVINTKKWHHLLGLQNTFMLRQMVKDFPWLRSIDTSNPVIAGLAGQTYEPVYEHVKGLPTYIYNGNTGRDKIETTVNELITCDHPGVETMDLICHNIRCFRDIINGNITETDDLDLVQESKVLDVLKKEKYINPMQINNIIANL